MKKLFKLHLFKIQTFTVPGVRRAARDGRQEVRIGTGGARNGSAPALHRHRLHLPHDPLPVRRKGLDFHDEEFPRFETQNS